MYYTTPVNHPVFAGKHEVQVTGTIGLAGVAAKTGVSVTDHVAAIAMYNFPLTGASYQAKEAELGIGLYKQSRKENGNVYSMYAGFGWGSNYDLDSGEVYKDFYGNYNRIFLSIGGGSTQGKIFKVVRVGGGYAFKLSYLSYHGYRSPDEFGNYDRFTGSNVYIEPYLYGNIGGKRVRLEYGTSFPLKMDFKWANDKNTNIRMFPFHFNIGLVMILGRQYD